MVNPGHTEMAERVYKGSEKSGKVQVFAGKNGSLVRQMRFLACRGEYFPLIERIRRMAEGDLSPTDGTD